MKKLVVMFILVTVLGLTACGQNNQTASVQTDNAQTETSVSDNAVPAAEVVPTPTPEPSFLQFIKYESKEVAKNSAGDPCEKAIGVLLPPSYYTSDKSYPVVYFLHGHSEGISGFMMAQKKAFATAFDDGAKEFILVGIDGSNSLGGSFYVNSPVQGNYEDWTVNEAIQYIDENYRTIADRDSRGICGFSMGGFGAYNLAFRHPDIYSCVIAMSPGVIADGELPNAMRTWANDRNFLQSYARAFSPNPEVEKVLGNIPVMDDSEEDLKIQEDWMNGFGHVDEKLDAYLALDNPLTAIKFVYGTMDEYKWIPSGCEFIAERMREKNIDFTLDVFQGVHSMPLRVLTDYMIPFFNENLKYE